MVEIDIWRADAASVRWSLRQAGRRAMIGATQESHAHPGINPHTLRLVMRPDDAVQPVPFTVNGRVWTYGGVKAAPNGQIYRTINDFSATESYSWRQESSADGKTWVAGQHGQSRRVH